MGYFYYWGRLDYDRALREFEAARRLQPSNSEVLGAIGYVERRRGHWDAAVARFREASRWTRCRSSGRSTWATPT